MQSLLYFFLLTPFFLRAQIPVADQTLRLDGAHQFAYALAEGDTLQLFLRELSGKTIKAVSVVQAPDNVLFRAYKPDSVLRKDIYIPQTGLYFLKIEESGLGKKVARFTLHRLPARGQNIRLNAQINWDAAANPQFVIRKKSVQTGVKTEVVSLNGRVTIPAARFGMQKPVNAWQFTLPPNTRQWAYRIAVGQAVQEARQKDGKVLASALQTGSVKMLAAQPQTALAAFALGLAIDLTLPKSGEDVAYALVDWYNWEKFAKGESYEAQMQQNAVSVDVQRRYNPLSGQWYLAFRNDNWVDAVDVTVDIEAVTEAPVFETEIYLEEIIRN